MLLGAGGIVAGGYSGLHGPTTDLGVIIFIICSLGLGLRHPRDPGCGINAESLPRSTAGSGQPPASMRSYSPNASGPFGRCREWHSQYAHDILLSRPVTPSMDLAQVVGFDEECDLIVLAQNSARNGGFSLGGYHTNQVWLPAGWPSVSSLEMPQSISSS